MIARLVSIIFHPFVMIGVMVGVASSSRQPAAEAARSVATVVVFTIVPVLLLMIRQVRSGAWANADASNQNERPILFLVGAIGLAALLGYVTLLRPQPFMVHGIAATLAMLAACTLATKWIKVSLHMAFAAFVATALAQTGSLVGYVLVPALALVAWARLTLGRHTVVEIALGALIGAIAGASIHYL